MQTKHLAVAPKQDLSCCERTAPSTCFRCMASEDLDWVVCCSLEARHSSFFQRCLQEIWVFILMSVSLSVSQWLRGQEIQVLSEWQGSTWPGPRLLFSIEVVLSPPLPSSSKACPSISLQPTLLVDRRQIGYARQMLKAPTDSMWSLIIFIVLDESNLVQSQLCNAKSGCARQSSTSMRIPIPFLGSSETDWLMTIKNINYWLNKTWFSDRWQRAGSHWDKHLY